MAELESWIAERIVKRAGLDPKPQMLSTLVQLLKKTREGRLFTAIEDPSTIPSNLWSDGSDSKKPLVIEGNRLYLQRNWAIEKKTMELVAEIRTRKIPAPEQEALYRAELDAIRDRFQPAQAKALSEAFAEPLTIFTGGPGTGKTYTASALIRLLCRSASALFKVAAAAPTGKAAAHLEASLRSQGELPGNLRLISTTLHRLLRLSPGRNQYFAERTIDADLVVVDEASMLDLSLMLHLLSAIGPRTRLLLLGDPDQLPPVESGSLFPEIADRYGHKLDRSIRMGDGTLYAFAQAIKDGNLSEIERIGYLSPDFSLSARNKLVEWLCSLIPSPLFTEQPDPKTCLEEQKKFRILGGLRQGLLGIDELNRLMLDSYLLNFKEWIAIPILIAKNDLRQSLYNGTTGVLIRKKGERFGTAHFEGLQPIPEQALPHFEVGFCISVHKSQGSEYDEVLALFQPGSERFGKEALYTAATRAKKKVTLAVDQATLVQALTINI